MRKSLALLMSLPILLAFSFTRPTGAVPHQDPSRPQFEISFSRAVRSEPVTGRVLLFISPIKGEARFHPHWAQFTFGMDVSNLQPGQAAVLNADAIGHPASLDKIPPGDYYVQAVLNVYTQFKRADGHVIWAHMDQWEGQSFNRSPGNVYSKPQKLTLSGAYTNKIDLTEIVPAIEPPADTEAVKRIKIKSKLLSEFWGRPIYLGAVILLPSGYGANPDVRFPVIYEQGHFSQKPAFNFETDKGLREAWLEGKVPRMIAVTFQHPTPYYDDSYAVNSANNGPYGDAIVSELIPYIEQHFRIIAQPYARILTGESTGGWSALALQLFHPEFFGGTWAFSPDPVDFRHYSVVDIYKDQNAFRFQRYPGEPAMFSPQRYLMRTNDGQPLISMEAHSKFEAVMGSRGRSAEQLAAWEASYGPVDEQGYPKPLWDKVTGTIDSNVASYMRDQGYDLRHYAATNWPKIGPHLVGKLHVYCGDMDNYFLNLGVYSFEEFLQSTEAPAYGGSFEYGRPSKGHSWRPMTNDKLLEIMAKHVVDHAPANANMDWKYQGIPAVSMQTQ